jgi:L-2-hydroxyglutarate oxidase LhgO
MDSFDFDACVVGAGAVGLACGFALAKRGQSVLVLEKETAFGQGVSSRNSEVIHAGRRALYPFLEAHKIAYRKCGKLVVASDPDQTPRLEAILAQAETNGVERMAAIDGATAMRLEPGLKAVAALISPESGVFDSHGYMLALRGEIEDRGGAVVEATPFLGATPLEFGGFEIRAGGDAPTTLTTRYLVTAPGLSAQTAAAAIEGFPADQIPALHFGKGVYFRLQGRAPFDRLIYPPPIPGALGVHYRKDLGGQAVFGPDLAYVETEDYSVDAARAEGFYSYVRHFWPALPDGALSPDYAGIRPKIHGPGEAQPDFRLDGAEAHGLEGLVALFGIESPGLTSSLAIGEAVAEKLLDLDRG